MKTGVGRITLAMMRAGAQTARVHRPFLRCDRNRRNQPNVDCGKREMGS
jgi:hypothetical protein